MSVTIQTLIFKFLSIIIIIIITYPHHSLKINIFSVLDPLSSTLDPCSLFVMIFMASRDNPKPLRNPVIPVFVREVWRYNVEFEFGLIRSLIDEFPFVSMDTEFPGVLYRRVSGDTSHFHMSPEQNYSILKRNVDALKMIQLGLTLTDSEGNLPDLGTKKKFGFVWQFNFREFDPARDRNAPDSVELLRDNGIDFKRNLRDGVDCVRFSELMMSSGLVCNGELVTWVTFHCPYDFGYLIKALTQRPLPNELSGFLNLTRLFFGENVFDVKYMIKFCNGLYGGLERLAKVLGLEREVGRAHQAGSDSLLTWRVFHRIRAVYFSMEGRVGLRDCAGFLYGLENS